MQKDNQLPLNHLNYHEIFCETRDFVKLNEKEIAVETVFGLYLYDNINKKF